MKRGTVAAVGCPRSHAESFAILLGLFCLVVAGARVLDDVWSTLSGSRGM